MFSPYRFAHQVFIHLPRTIQNADPSPIRTEEGLRPDFIEAGFTHMDVQGLSENGCTQYNADILRTFWYGC
jgi:hypothetical protein